MIKSITNEEEGVVTLLEGMKHPYQDGDYVVFSRVKGMELVKETMEEKSPEQLFYEDQTGQKVDGINNRVYKIQVINWNSFKIGDTRNFAEYQGNGLCRNIKMPQKKEYQSLSVC